MRFIADNTVGKLRRWLSLLGYDIVYDPRPARAILRALREAPNAPPPSDQSAAEPDASGCVRGGVIVLGRCPSLATEEASLAPVGSAGERISSYPAFFQVESPRLSSQIREVTRAFPMDFAKAAFTRCSCCNLELEGPLALGAVADQVPALVREWRTEYYRCPACERVYWDGTHTEHVRAFLRDEAGLAL